MNRKQYPKPIVGEQKYVDFDEESQLWCVFGTDSGHAYSSSADKHQAEDDLTERLQNECETQRRDEKHGLYSQHEDPAN